MLDGLVTEEEGEGSMLLLFFFLFSSLIEVVVLAGCFRHLLTGGVRWGRVQHCFSSPSCFSFLLLRGLFQAVRFSEFCVSLIRASCGELKSEWKSFTNGSLDYVTDLVR